MILEAKQLSKTFEQGDNQIRVLNSISLNIDAKQSLAIVGPSGSGKSTLLSIISGLEKPDRGDVLYNNKSIYSFNDSDLSSWRRSETSMVFQQYHLFPHLTALENVLLPLNLLATDCAEDKAQDMLKRVGLADRVNHLPSKLSGGESQRVAIARALVHRPKLIFADEPSGNLDIKTGESVMNLFFELIEENNSAVILVTHNLDLAKQCQNIFDMSQHNKV